MTAARGLLGITQEELATAANLSYRTILNFETGTAETSPQSIQKIVAELERRGIEFTNGDSLPTSGRGIGVRLNLDKAAAFAVGAANPGQS